MKKIKIVGLFVLLVISSVFTYTDAKELPGDVESYSIVYLEGAFLKEGEYIFYDDMTINDLIEDVGVEKNANLNCLKLDKLVTDESHIYLPVINDHQISLNHGNKEELMSLKGIGEKTAQKIIDYRSEKEFECLEEIMNIKGIGEKTFIKLRDYLCL